MVAERIKRENRRKLGYEAAPNRIAVQLFVVL